MLARAMSVYFSSGVHARNGVSTCDAVKMAKLIEEASALALTHKTMMNSSGYVKHLQRLKPLLSFRRDAVTRHP